MTDVNKRIIRDWLTVLLRQVEERGRGGGDDVDLRTCAGAHYEAIRMEERIKDLKGNLPGFINFLESKLDWIVKHDEASRTIEADENKPDCVCPLYKEELLSDPALCECSRGFAERMFGYILEKKVEASIVGSILRKNPRCVYRIRY